MNWKMMKISFVWIFNEVRKRVNNFEGKPVPNDPVASRDKRSTDNAGNGSDNVQHDSKSSKTLCQILGIE